jgi:coenzyme F420-dependent oxidoreductase
MATNRDVFLPVAAQPSVDALVEQAQSAEAMGYDRAWLPESWGRNAAVVLTSIAERTEEIGIGTSIMPVYSRSPALIGMTAATLQEVADGRLRLGVGPSGPIVIENWHGMDFGNPLRRTRETVDVVKQVLSGEEVSYDGEYFDLDGFRLRCDPPEPQPPIDAAGMGPKAVELAGRFADGWHALMLTEDGLAERYGDFRQGRELADKDPDGGQVTLSLTCMALEDRERAREAVKQHVCFYIGAMGTYYRDNLARQGYDELAHGVYDDWQAGNRESAMERVGDDFLDTIAVGGTPDECRERVAEWEAMDCVDRVSVSFPRAATTDEILHTVEELAPEQTD